MNILIIDAQGGGIGRHLTSAIRQGFPDADITAVGTNSIATTAMLKAGANHGATGENDVIVGPIGIVIADSLYGEVTPAMAVAIGQSRAKRILIPVNHCENIVVGVRDLSIKGLVEEVLLELQKMTS